MDPGANIYVYVIQAIHTQNAAGVGLRVLQPVGGVREQVGHRGEEREVEEADVVEKLVLGDEVHQPECCFWGGGLRSVCERGPSAWLNFGLRMDEMWVWCTHTYIMLFLTVR